MNRIVLSSLIALTAGCDLEAPCTPDTFRCDAGALEQCVAHPGGFSGGGIGDIHHSDSSPSTWELAANCGPALCIAPDAGTAFCALDAEPSASCTDSASIVCEGTTAAQCQSGHVVERTACSACLASSGCDPFLDSTCCTGHQNSPCQTDADCANGMSCITVGGTGSCQMACTCAEGTACPACNVLWDRSAYPDGAPSQWVCTSSLCALQFQ